MYSNNTHFNENIIYCMYDHTEVYKIRATECNNEQVDIK